MKRFKIPIVIGSIIIILFFVNLRFDLIDRVSVQFSSEKYAEFISEIDYEKVPSKANLLYSEAFLKNDKLRRNQYLSDLENGKAKINSSVTFPYEIVHK